jgi:membrane protein YfhO
VRGESPLAPRHLVLALLFLALWILPPFWRIATLQTVNIQDDIFTSDLLNDRLPVRAAVGASLARGDTPFWMPGIYTGFPSLAQIEVGTLYPTNLLLFGLLDPYAAIAWAQILPLFVAGLGAFLLAREYALPLEASLLAAGSFSLSGFFVAHLRQLNMVDAACWIPLLLVCAERIAWRRSGRAPLALALIWALQLLAGHPQISYFTGLVLIPYFFVRVWQVAGVSAALRFRGWKAPRSSEILLPLALGTLIAAAQLLPTIELSGLTDRERGLSLEDASRYAVSPYNLWTFFKPDLFGDAANDDFRLSGIFWEQYGYLGLLPALLAVVALVVERRRPVVRLLAAVASLSYLLVLGSSTPVFGWAFALIPGMAYFRFPTRFLVFVDLALAMLGAFGLAACLEALAGRTRRGLLAASIVALTAVDLWGHQMRQVPQVGRREWLSPIGTEQILAAERGDSAWRYYTLGSALVHAQTYHAARGWAGDLQPYIRLRALLQPSFNLLFGLESPDGYANLVPRHYEAVWGSEKKPGVVMPGGLRGELDSGPLNMLRLFNVRFLLSPWPLRSAALRRVDRSVEGVEIYEIMNSLPRAFVVGEAIGAESDEEALRLLTSARFDAERQAIVEDTEAKLPPDAGASRRVRIVERGNVRAVIRASLEKPGLLVLSEGYYPGWRATIDGAEARILRTNVMMRGVVVPAGEHEIGFEFRSATIRAGFFLSLLGIAALALLRRRLVLTTSS